VPGLGWVEAARDDRPGIQIRLRRIDGLIEDGSIRVAPPVFMKIDVEGGEAAVLRGAAGLLRRYRPVIYFECQAALLARQNETAEGVWRELGAGYRVLGNRSGEFVPVAGLEGDIVNYLAVPDGGPAQGSGEFDAAALSASIDRWAHDSMNS
jgi:hypothetical protein